MDQLSAHLDRGWDLAQKGDAAGALACARRALEIDPKSPEVHNLLGFASALDGDTDCAIEHYRQAVTLDETHFEAMLNAAELLISPLGDWNEALAMCNDALDYAETNEEIADCVLLKVDALMGKGATEEAAKTLAMVPDGPYDNPTYDYLVGRAYYEVGQPDKAAPLIEGAVKRAPLHADARYYLGLLRDEQGDRQGATDAFLHSRQLDLREPAPSWSPSPEVFGGLVRKVVAKLDAALARATCARSRSTASTSSAPSSSSTASTRARSSSSTRARPRREPRRRTADPTQDDADPAGRIFVYQRGVERTAGSLGGSRTSSSRARARDRAHVFVEASADGAGRSTRRSSTNRRWGSRPGRQCHAPNESPRSRRTEAPRRARR